MTQKLTLHTDVWCRDRTIELEIPDSWDLVVHHPKVEKPLSPEQIRVGLDAPVGQAPLRQLCRGKTAPLILVDDLNRPTPVASVMPHLLEIFSLEGIDAADVTILMATGTHGPPPDGGMKMKVGDEASRACRTLIHDCFQNVRKIGKTSFGTPVFVNKAVLESDFVIGIGGVYPNYTAGFGGGTKIVLGALGMRSIFHLHANHPGSGWGGPDLYGSFRKDLDEIAEMIGLKFCVSLIANPSRDVIKLFCGGPQKYFPDAVRYCRQVFSAPGPVNADVVISNAYPNDLSLTFARTKGFYPLKLGPERASRIAVATCREGVGLHNIYPYANIPRFFEVRHIARSLAALPLKQILGRGQERLATRWRSQSKSDIRTSSKRAETISRPIWMFRPGDEGLPPLPESLPGLRIESDWQEIVDAVSREQTGKQSLKVDVYSCAFLQNIS